MIYAPRQGTEAYLVKECMAGDKREHDMAVSRLSLAKEIENS